MGIEDTGNKVRLMLAGLLTGIATVFAALNPSSQLSVYSFLFTVANFAGISFSLSSEKMPVKTVLAQGVMLSAGFTAVTATYFAESVPPAEPQNILVYTILFLLVSLQVLPREITEKLSQ